jgi:hypothetical protein
MARRLVIPWTAIPRVAPTPGRGRHDDPLFCRWADRELAGLLALHAPKYVVIAYGEACAEFSPDSLRHLLRLRQN